MKRLLRIIFNFLTVLSLLLCVATVVMWVRSYWVAESLDWQRTFGSITLGSARGKCAALQIGTLEKADQPLGVGWTYTKGPPLDFGLGLTGNPQIYHSFAGVIYIDGRELDLVSYRMLIVPLWIPSTMFAILPLYSGWRMTSRRRTRRRRIAGLCLTCGYDLRATPDRCPECGNVPTIRTRTGNDQDTARL